MPEESGNKVLNDIFGYKKQDETSSLRYYVTGKLTV
jgi:hypothetical protein